MVKISICMMIRKSFMKSNGKIWSCDWTCAESYSTSKSWHAGPYWKWKNSSQLTHWNFSGYHNPCKENWQGLICNCSTNQSTVIIDHTIKIVFPATSNNNSNCSIIAITLPHFNMSGHLPLSIGNVSALQLLSVSNNHIHGPIPYTLGKLSSLSAIDFGRNFFTGSIPIEIFGMRHLKYLIFERYCSLESSL